MRILFELIFLFLPQVIAIVLPISALAATIYTINIMSSESELIILDCAGLSPYNILKPFLYFAFLTSILTAILSLYLVPISRSQMDLRKGGFVPIGKKERADDVPARLSKNEFVMTADAVRAAGGGSVNKGAKRMYETMNKLEARA